MSKVVGRDNIISEFNSILEKTKKGQGQIILLTGESGFGKSYIMSHLYSKCKSFTELYRTAFVDIQKPIGKFQISNLQPLEPFSRIIEQLLQNKAISPEKKFARNVGMTTLAALPFIGDVFYAVKELGRDWREFKKDKSSSNLQKVNSVTADYFDTICSCGNSKPLILFIDDIQWCDAQSIELISLLSEILTELPIVIVLSATMSEVQKSAIPILSFIKKYENNEQILKIIELKTFTNKEIGKLAFDIVENYKHNNEFENWVNKHSYGIPSVVIEYLNYFGKFSPFMPDGSLATNLEGNEYLPTSIQAVFARKLEDLNEEEKNILSVCSSEGREFTAIVMAELLNSDVLTTIKKLRAIQNKSGIIKSLGAKERYGMKTTVYQFAQMFEHNYFESLLEYEEYTALHGQIASYLKQKYLESKDEEQKQILAPYLAAHSAESGDNEMAQEMMLIAAQTAHKYGSKDIIEQAYEQYELLKNPNIEVSEDNNNFFQEIFEQYSKEENGNIINQEQAISPILLDFTSVKNSVLNLFEQNKYSEAAKIAMNYYDTNANKLSSMQKIVLLHLAAKGYMECNEFELAENTLNIADENIVQNNENEFHCLQYNLFALLKHYRKKETLAMSYLQKAAKLSLQLPTELRLLTLSNIALVLKDLSHKDARKYYFSALNLSETLDFKFFTEVLHTGFEN